MSTRQLDHRLWNDCDKRASAGSPLGCVLGHGCRLQRGAGSAEAHVTSVAEESLARLMARLGATTLCTHCAACGFPRSWLDPRASLDSGITHELRSHRHLYELLNSKITKDLVTQTQDHTTPRDSKLKILNSSVKILRCGVTRCSPRQAAGLRLPLPCPPRSPPRVHPLPCHERAGSTWH